MERKKDNDGDNDDGAITATCSPQRCQRCHENEDEGKTRKLVLCDANPTYRTDGLALAEFRRMLDSVIHLSCN